MPVCSNASRSLLEEAAEAPTAYAAKASNTTAAVQRLVCFMNVLCVAETAEMAACSHNLEAGDRSEAADPAATGGECSRKRNDLCSDKPSRSDPRFLIPNG